MRILGVIPAYNEADCVANAIRAQLRSCDEIHVFDHGSTDGTASIVDSFGPPVYREVVDREEVPPKDTAGRQSFALWHLIARFIIDRQHEFDWVVWSDADDLMREPDGRLATHEGIEREAARGTQVIRPLIRLFWPSTIDPTEGSYLNRLRYCMTRPQGHAPRAWQTILTPPNLPAGAHVQDPAIRPKRWPFYLLWPVGTRVSNNEWLSDRYPFRSPEQIDRKILRERDWITPLGKKRFVEYQTAGRVTGLVRDHRRMTQETRELEMP
jgi:glycosyltransferase involved in cell wall biosynthesis